MTSPGEPRGQVLNAAYEAVMERGDEYGSPHDNFTQVANLWTAAFEVQFTGRDVAVALALLKVARITSGGSIDSWVDLAGYAACGGEIDFVDFNNNAPSAPSDPIQAVELDEETLPEPEPPTAEMLDDFANDLERAGYYDAPPGDPTVGFTVDGRNLI